MWSVAALLGIGLLAFYGTVIITQRTLIYFPPKEDPLRPSAVRVPYEDAEVTAADGIRLAAWLVPPPHPHDPVVLFFHGNACSLSGIIDLAPQFRHLGFGMAAVDYRGYGRSQGAPSERGLRMDAEAAYDWLKSSGITPNRIVIWGQSLGGGVASWLAGQVPCAGLVLESAPPSLIAEARVHYAWLPVPEFLLLDRYRTVDHVVQVRCPVLVLHGTLDDIVPTPLARSVYDAAREPKTWVEINGADHNEITPAFPAVSKALTTLRQDLAHNP